MHSVDPVWEEGSDRLDFQFGPYTLCRVPLKVLALQTNAFVVSPDLEVPLDEAIRQGYQAAVKYGTPINLNFPAIRIQGGSLRYVPRYGHRYVVDLEGSFREYLRKFSKKARGNLQRTVKKIVQASGGFTDFREYRSPSEIMAFRDIAIAISRRSYKKDIGWGFQEGEDFARRLESDAASGTVRGYVLMLDGEPAAYVFCRIDHDVIVYKHIGYDDRFAKHSPGTALLYLLLERLFEECEFRVLDFDNGEYYPYKEFFATRAVRCARVVWFRPTARNLALVIAHWVVTASWRLASALRGLTRRSRREWVSVQWVSVRPHIAQSRRSSRST